MLIALITNELRTNAVYRVEQKGRGTIGVRFKKFLLYVVEDVRASICNWSGNDPSRLRLVQGLARQLGGTFEVTRTPATRCSVRFKSWAFMQA
jgi:two-component sensor histidine kinase